MSRTVEQQMAELATKIQVEQNLLQGAKLMLNSLRDQNAREQCEASIVESQRRLEFMESRMKTLQSGGEGAQGGGIQNSNSFGANGSPPSTVGIHPRTISMEAVASSTFDLVKYGSAITSEKVRFRLKEVRHKLETENRVKAGTENLLNAMGRGAGVGGGATQSGDPRMVAELRDKMAESNARITALTKADHRYAALYVATGEEDDTLMDVRVKSTGRLKLRLVGATNLPGRTSLQSEVFATIRIDGQPKAMTRPKSQRWDENFDLPVEKAVECEIAVYSKPQNNLCAISWFRITELAEDLKLKYKGINPPQDLNGVDEVWLDMEPAGQILVRLNFVAGGGKMQGDLAGIHRREAVQKAYPRNGHKFFNYSSYQVIQCAVCNEKLGTALGYRCASCLYTIHARCYTDVITKCITMNEMKTAPPGTDLNTGQLLKFKIPHRFEQKLNLGVDWCMHCGMIATPGSRIHRCSECSKCAHRECSPMAPYFCGLAPNDAKILIEAFKRAEEMSHRRELEAAEKFRKELEDRQMSQQIQGMSVSDQSQQQQTPSSPQQNHVTIPPRAGSFQGTEGFSYGSPRISTSQSTPQQQQYQQSPSPYPQQQYQQQQPVPLPTQQHPVTVDASKTSAEDARIAEEIRQLKLSAAKREAEKQAKVEAERREREKKLAAQREAERKEAERLQAQQKINLPTNVNKTVSINDFHFIAVLGRGAFGKVMLASEKQTGKYYAIKALKKEYIIQNDDVKSAKLERRIFQAASATQHPFMVNLHSCFQTPERVYFVMEYVSGGDLMCHIQEKKRFSQNRAKFYACEVLLALEYFHRNNIIYRDLKLDNILMSPDGHLKVADYGICKENMPYGATTRTYCGTPDYMAPEILAQNKYGRAVDWWSFGVLIYVMLVGRYPFHGEDESDILDSIMSDSIEYPSNMPKDTLSLLHGLLHKDPTRRLGGGKLDAEEVKRHPYFAGVDWGAFMAKRMAPPWKPTITNATDVSNFDAEFTKEPAVLTPIQSVLQAVQQKEFEDFDYVAEWVWVQRGG